MARVVSVHEYELRPGMEPADFERALSDAEWRGLLARDPDTIRFTSYEEIGR